MSGYASDRFCAQISGGEDCSSFRCIRRETCSQPCTRCNCALSYCPLTLSSRPSPVAWRRRSTGEWRDLLCEFSVYAASQQQVPRLRRSFASRTIFFARDDRVVSRRLLLLWFKLMSHIPFNCQIFPRGITLRDQPIFLCPVPAFQLFLPIDRFVHIVKCFVVHQTVALILPRETFNQIVFVLKYPAVKIVRHSDV